MIKTVVITGGSSGMGLDLAKAYAKLDYNVLLLARNKERLDNAVFECKTYCINNLQQVIGYSVDVTDKASLKACARDISENFNALDLLILSAGVVSCERFIDQHDDDFELLMQTNVFGASAVARAFLPNMITNGHGQICFIGSVAGLMQTYGYSAYNASKFALIGVAGAMRQELTDHNIKVNVLCPPEVDTPMVVKESKTILPQTRYLKDLLGTISVEQVTQSVIKGLAKNQFIIIPSAKARFFYWQKRMFPNLFEKINQMLIRYVSKKHIEN